MSVLKHFFPRDEAFSYEALRAAGYSNYGGADLSEVIAICSRIRPGSEDSWMQEWKAAADRAVANAETSISLGNRVSANESYLRASNYYRTAEFFRRQDPFNDQVALDLYQKSVDTFISAMHLTDYVFEQVEIPFEEATLPGYFMRPDKSVAPHATIILNNGFDGSKEETWFVIAAPALRRGFNVLVFDGPGQGMAIRRDRLFFRADWESVLTPVVDYALGRPDVAADKIILFGLSMGGYLAARGATKEHRAAALILDDGVFDFGSSFRNATPRWVDYLIRNHWDGTVTAAIKLIMGTDTGARWGLSNGKWTFGASSEVEFLREVAKYTLEGRTDGIITPTLVLDAPDDHFLKGQPAELYRVLSCEKTLITLSADEGASCHCHMGSFSRLHQVVFDYLARFA